MEETLKVAVGAIVGALTTFALFSSRVTRVETSLASYIMLAKGQREQDKELIDVQLEGIRSDISNAAKRAEELHRRIEKRQMTSLEILAAIARKSDVHHRAIGSDALVRSMGDGDE